MDLKNAPLHEYSIIPPNLTYSIGLEHRLHGDNRVRIHTGRRLGGWRGWMAEWLRRFASRVDGRHACVVEVDSTMPFKEEDLSKAFGRALKGLCDNFAESIALEVTEKDLGWYMQEQADSLDRIYTPPPR